MATKDEQTQYNPHTILLIVLIILIFFVILFGIGYYVYNKHNQPIIDLNL